MNQSSAVFSSSVSLHSYSYEGTDSHFDLLHVHLRHSKSAKQESRFVQDCSEVRKTTRSRFQDGFRSSQRRFLAKNSRCKGTDDVIDEKFAEHIFPSAF